MIRGPILIDTNVFLLLVAGSTGRALIAAHKNVANQFTDEDFVSLLDTLGEQPELVLLPNVVTETANLGAQIKEPYRSRLLTTLRAAVLLSRETYISSALAVMHPDFLRLGLSDCAALSTQDARFHLLTVDFDLYHSFLRSGRPVTNFRHVIDARS